ncbi:uncharacterized protein LOC8274332 [Ricinus communis]|uniref:Uncharacterized protein n=1 Tax=Ricinus communis TaxID=3988 RepID=B9RIG4_RICCO|nr:uncharacterized protein LOC8274332 [Ricinus communis]EEF48936.1 conserved hypothetical protein [Ricinus communis]|eukprot:XP_002513533.1 uncharacterized protein LOC8274332 [Ricinus communis]
MYGSKNSAESCNSSKKKVTVDQNKIRWLKEKRDYSFLSSDDPAPVPVLPKPKEMATDPALKANPQSASMAGSRKQLNNGRKIMPLRNNTNMENKNTIKPGLKKHRVQETKIMPKLSLVAGQLKRPGIKQHPSHVVQRKKRPATENDYDYDHEAEKALSIIRKMYNTQRFIGRDDSDCVNMESSPKQIEKEEKQSARIARKEDRQQLRLIQEEEKGMRKKAKRV